MPAPGFTGISRGSAMQDDSGQGACPELPELIHFEYFTGQGIDGRITETRFRVRGEWQVHTGTY
jgi:hypothetical protein